MALFYTGISTILGLILIWMSKNQPFPEHSQKFGFLLIILGSLGFIAEQAEREVGPTVEPLILSLIHI